MPYVVVVALAGCSADATGVHVTAHLGTLQYDELRFGLTSAGGGGDGGAGTTLVDPSTIGRRVGPFRAGGDQDVVILLRDEAAGQTVVCDVAALAGGAATAHGQAAVVVQSHQIRDVDVFIQGAPADGSAGGGTGANGDRCNVASDCVSTRCVDGFCCESACDATCSTCRSAGEEGLCRHVAAGAPDPRGICMDSGAASCNTNGLCDVSGRCALYPLDTVCVPSRCLDDQTMSSASTCNGNGACGGGGAQIECPDPPQQCSNGACL
jgi:hypothetical protein